jgi:2-polyprenyl-3-methyl-5-hydroxy-6-metoxy-1,4-benzoquinol methylase
MPPNATDYRQTIKAHWEANRLDLAAVEAWQAYDASPSDQATKALLADLLRASPEQISADRLPALRALLSDPSIDPSTIAQAGWRYLQRFSDLFPNLAAEPPSEPPSDAEHAAMAARLEANGFARQLLAQDLVTYLGVEMALRGLRRWLYLAQRWRDFPLSVEALARQAALNEGAWPFDAEERAQLDRDGVTAMARAYRPMLPGRDGRSGADNPVTRAVAEQYEAWPYPQWLRVTAPESSTLADRVRKLDPDGPDTIPRAAEILIAGCGTGKQAAAAALHYPDARITAIDISEASLRYAKARCDEAGLSGISFQQLDLHQVGDLGRHFDAVFCTGVLHHLPDPERGWAALIEVLKPGGVMHVGVYSSVARLIVRGWRAAITDLDTGVVDDDLLREVRRRVIDRNPQRAPRTRDFYSLSGVHDLLLHRQEDPFDVPRIQRALDRLGLEFIHFKLPTHQATAQYRADNPLDPLHRDVAAWLRAERGNPGLFLTMYDFWCRKPLATP